jgi:hypothetical protein
MVNLIEQAIYNEVSGNGHLNKDPDYIYSIDFIADDAENIHKILDSYEQVRKQLKIDPGDIQTGIIALTAMMNVGRKNPNADLLEVARVAVLNHRSGAGPSNTQPQPPPAPRKRKLTREEAIFDRIRRLADEQPIIKYPIKKRKVIVSESEKQEKRNKNLKFQNDDCAICQESLRNGKKVCMVYECEHLFHCYCIHAWANIISNDVKSCPICREAFLQENILDVNLRSKPQSSGSTTTDGKSGGVEPGEEVNSFGKSILSDLRYLKNLRTKVRKVGR